jgi:sugar lactone lactonase YvrE
VTIETPTEAVASGLDHPRGLAFASDGSLYVAEAGSGGPQLVDVGRDRPHAVGRSGRISRISPDGRRDVVADGLPSIVTAANEQVGPSGLAFIGDDLYLLTASGGWEIGDPEFHNAVFRVSPDGTLERILDYSAYTLEHPTRSRLEDPRADVPLGMPYGLAALNGNLYSTDGNQEQILEISPSGEVRRIVEYPRSDRALTGITPGPDGALYVAEYAARKVTRVALDGSISEVAAGFRAPPIGVAFDRDGTLYVVEYSTGRVSTLVPGGPTQPVQLGQVPPEATALAFGPDGDLYVSTGGGKTKAGLRESPVGQIVRLRLSPASSGQTGVPPTTSSSRLASPVLALAAALAWRRPRRLRAGRSPGCELRRT